MLQKKINLTKTVRKLPINDQLERAGHYLYDDRQLEIKYDDPSVCPCFQHLHGFSSKCYGSIPWLTRLCVDLCCLCSP